MVATDVASRGIGMITDTPITLFLFFIHFPFFLFRSTFIAMRGLNSALLLKLVRSIRCTHDLVQGEQT